MPVLINPKRLVGIWIGPANSARFPDGVDSDKKPALPTQVHQARRANGDVARLPLHPGQRLLGVAMQRGLMGTVESRSGTTPDVSG